MLRRIKEFIKKEQLIQAGDRIVAGFSGGADSVSLLLVLKELQKSGDFFFCAVHVEHGIRGAESLRDAAFAQEFCSRHAIPFRLFAVDAPAEAKREKQSLEEAARNLRYACYDVACEEFSCNKIALAHHAGDQAETILFHLCRGTGAAGLGGIRPGRDRIIRPLLCVTREEIEGFLTSRGEEYCRDSTNEDLSYARNRIRLQVIPQLEQINAGAQRNIARLSETMAGISDFLSREAWGRMPGAVFFYDPKGADISDRIYAIRDERNLQRSRHPGDDSVQETVRPDHIRIQKEAASALHPALRRQILFELTGLAAGSRKDLSLVHIEALETLLGAQVGKRADLPYGLYAEAGYETIWIRHKCESEEEPAGEVFILPDHGALTLPDGSTLTSRTFVFSGNPEEIPREMCTKWFDYAKIAQIISVRRRKKGDYLIINAQGGRKKLNDYLTDEKIPARERDHLWVLAADSQILWIPGYRMSEAFRITEETGRVLEVRYLPPA